MKRIVLAAVAVCLILSGCATTGQTPAQVSANLITQVHKACAVAQPTLASLQLMQSQLTAPQQADVAKAATIVTEVCTSTEIGRAHV